MKKSLVCFVFFFLIAVFLAVPLGMSSALAADSGGYGAAAPASSSSGYGAAAPASSSSGYGAAAPAKASSGYGAAAPAKEAPAKASSGYGAAAPAKASSGYGAAAPAKEAPAKASSGYGAPAPAKAASGYGAPKAEAPAASAKKAAAGYGAEKAAAPAASSGYGGEKAAPAAEEEAVAAPAAPVEQAPATVEEVAPPSNKMGISFVLSALVVGMLLGWVLQRGRFCMNTAFRDTIFIKDMTLLRAYVIALMVSIVGANLLNDYFHVVHLARQPFFPIAQIIGGYVFGLGIVLAGGCGSGIWYRAGEGQIASFVAIAGFFAGIVTTVDGVLKPLNQKMMSVKLQIAGENAPGLWHLIPVSDSMAVKWGTIAVLVIAAFIFIQKDKPFSLGKQKGYYWSVTGLMVGLVSVLAFWASEHYGGFARGLSFTTPTRELFYTIFEGTSHSRFFPNKELTYLGYTVSTTWGIFFIVGVPLGSYLSARGFKEFAWKTPPAKEMLVVFGGSLMMGFGASTALGCNMGQGITGFSTLSIGSIAATIAILLGNWTMVYFKFIKPMGDMDLD